MEYRGGVLTEADLPRLMANMKRIQKLVRELKKEVGQTKAPTAESFWDSYAQAVAKVSQCERRMSDETWLICERRKALGYGMPPPVAYGDRWKVHAKPDETVLVRLPKALCAGKELRKGQVWGGYRRDQRLPAAQFWPGGQLPSVAMEVAPEPKVTPWVMVNGVETNPILASLNEFLETEREARDNFQEMAKIDSEMQAEYKARQHKRDRIVRDICEDAERMEFNETVEAIEIERAHALLDRGAHNRAQIIQLAEWCVEEDAEQMEWREVKREMIEAYQEERMAA